MENKLHITDGLLRDNTVLSAGMIISPVIICTTSFRDSLALVYA
ncbi:MAG TPA: electron transport complex subunit E, partial [Ruminococcus sp.]|nr:electron transport complex subunit E [Ruminococcus sp.]